MNLSHTIRIQASARQVFFWLEDPERATQWMSSVSHTEVINRTPELTGTTFRETVTDGQGSTTLDGIVLSCTPPEEIKFKLSGKHNDVHVQYRLVELKGETELKLEAGVDFKSMLARTMGGMFKKQINEQLTLELSNLKHLCERGDPNVEV